MPLTIDLSGKTAWVTGGASGIGAAIVEILESAGARVVSIDRLEQTPVSTSRVAITLDVTKSAAVAQLAADLSGRGLDPDVLVNNAGIARDAMVWKMTDEQWHDVLEVNLGGAFRMTRACAPTMRRRRAGAIVNIASINALRGKIGQANYAASKSGLVAFTKATARELARDGVRVNAVAPG